MTPSLRLGVSVIGLLLTLWPADQAGAEVTFIDRSAALTLGPIYSGGWEHFVGGGVAVFDCNHDDRPDLFLAGGEAPAVFYVNTSAPGGSLNFAPVTIADLPALNRVTGAYPLDIDSDGQMDLAVLRAGPDLLLRGTGDCQFEDASAHWGVTFEDRWTTAFTATWERGQTLPTLAFGHYVDRSNPDGPFEACDTHWLLRPQGDSYGAPVELSPGFCTLSMLISDPDRSDTPTLRISNDRHYYVRAGREQVWQLSPLRELGEADGVDRISIWGMGIASHDLTGDGRPELMLTSMGDQLMLIDRGDGTYDRAPYGLGTYAQRPHIGDDGRPSTGWHAEFGDVNNDGRMDLFIAKGNVDQMPGLAMKDPNNLLLQGADGTFVEGAAQAGIATTARSRGARLADLNGDGRLDLIVVNRRAAPELWQNDSMAGTWLGVALSQPGPNPRAVGSWVDLRLPSGRIVTQELTIGGGHVSGEALPFHFGLGQATQADIRVRWPGGTETDWTTLTAGQVHRLTRPQAP